MELNMKSPQAYVKEALASLQAAQQAVTADFSARHLESRLSKAVSFLEILIPEFPSGQADGAAEVVSETVYSTQVLPVEQMLEPISGEKPAGVRDMSELRKLQALIVDRSGKPDFVPQYREALKASTDLIRNKCKDLAVTMIMIESAFETYGFSAVADGLLLINGFIDRYWDDFYPQAPDGDFEKRSNELESLNKLVIRFSARCGDPKNYVPAGGQDRASIEKEKSIFDCISRQYDILYKEMYERFKEQSPDLRNFIKAIEPYRTKIDQSYKQFIQRDNADRAASADRLDKALQAEIDKTNLRKEEEQRLKAIEEQIESMPRITRDPLSTQDACERIDRCAAFLVEAAPHDPLGYILNRARRWFSGLHKDFKTFPSPEDRQSIGQLITERRWKDVLVKSENIFMNGGDSWLDLQRFSVQAAQALGGKYEPVRKHLLSNALDIMDVDESVLEKQLADMTPAAGIETRDWLKEEKQARTPANSRGAAVGAGGIDTELNSLIERGAHGDVAGAVDVIVNHVFTSQSSRERFLWQLGLVEFFINCNQGKMAVPLIEELTGILADRKIDEWESRDFLIRFYKAGYDGYLTAFGVQKAPAEKVDFYFNRLCLYNPGLFIKRK